MGSPTGTEAILAQATEIRRSLKPLFSRVSELRRRVSENPSSKEAKAELAAAESEASAASEALGEATRRVIEALGLSEEDIDLLSDRSDPGDEVDRRPRLSVAAGEIEPTGRVDDHISATYEVLKSVAPADWLRTEWDHGHRLADRFRSTPLSLIRGSRIESEVRPIHRYAQLLGVVDDFRQNRADYDFFAGATLVPQAVALALKIDHLREIQGDINDRLSALWRLPTDTVESTIYELVVGATCVERGRELESLPAGQAKTPDFRVHDYSFPAVIECKRKQAFSDSDIAEERTMRSLFLTLREEVLKHGMIGRFDLILRVEDPPIRDIIDAARRQRFAAYPRTATEYPWGTIGWTELPRRVAFPATRLYSPIMLKHVFGWNTDIPVADGIICQVEDPGALELDEVRAPLALTWSNDSPALLRRRARTIAALYGAAFKQIPAGELGIVYASYQEGDRPAIADDRMAFMEKQLEEWTHRWEIRVPISIVTRLIPRPLAHGAPDLVETGMRIVSGHYGDPSWFADFPTAVYT